MNARVAALLVAAISGTMAQQTLPLETGRQAPVLEQLSHSPLPPEQKERTRLALEAKDYKAAETILVRAIDANPKSAGLLILAAHVFSLDKNPMSAAIAFKKAEKIRPLEAADRFALAMAYLGFQRGAWARPELDKLAQAEPQNVLYPYWLARIDFDEHKYDSAIERLQWVTKAKPDFMRAWDNLGLSQEGAGRLAEAVASYRRAILLDRKQNPRSPWPLLNLGTLLTKMGEFKEAEALLREAVGCQDTLAEAHYRLGANLLRQSREKEAIVELRHSCDLDPEATEPLYALGQLYRKQGDEKSAATMFERFRVLKKKKRGA
ncbi:MAG TPA: tetratricopeptide repeat protein [Bryobacteraceae bacterium]